MKLASYFSLLSLVFVAACSNQPPSSTPAGQGADRDAHGCIPSAGYAWCAKTNQCERPWELAEKHSFENSDQAFKSFCGEH